MRIGDKYPSPRGDSLTIVLIKRKTDGVIGQLVGLLEGIRFGGDKVRIPNLRWYVWIPQKGVWVKEWVGYVGVISSIELQIP